MTAINGKLQADTAFIEILKTIHHINAKQLNRIYPANILFPRRVDLTRDYFITHYLRNFTLNLFYNAYAYQSIDRYVISICQGN